MGRAWAVAACLLAPPLQAGEKSFKASFFGEGGGTQPATTGPAAQFLEETPPPPPGWTPPGETATVKPAERAPTPRLRAETPQASVSPAETRALRYRPIGAFVPVDPAARRYRERAETPAAEGLRDAVADRPAAEPAPEKFALWAGASAPAALTPAKAAEADLDELRGRAGDDYDRRVLGLEPAKRSAASAPLEPAPAPPRAGELFVAVELSVEETSNLKDAVSDLSRASGFKPDARFAPQAAPPAAGRRRVSVRGWLPSGRVGHAATAPGVTRLEIEKPGFVHRPDGATAELLVGLRIPAEASAADTFQRTVRELGESAQLRWKRTIGFQALPNTPDAALVILADVPVTRIPKVLEHPAVLKIGPPPAPEPTVAPTPRRSKAVRFLDYVGGQAPLLLVLTALALLPAFLRLMGRLGRAL